MNGLGRLALAAAALASSAGPAAAGSDWGTRVERALRARSAKRFGIARPLEPGGADGLSVLRAPGQTADDLVVVAKGLRARIVTRRAAGPTDMIALWPDDAAPTHLVVCIEGARGSIGAPGATLPGAGNVAKLNPSVQRIALATGAVETVLRGMSSCDGIRRTPWGTVLATEENGSGQAYEILDPLAATDLTVTDRAAPGGAPGAIVDPDGADSAAQVVKRDALPTLAWEGFDLTPEGVVYAGDELRPGTGGADRDGGSIYKFVPAAPHAGGAVASLADSPLAAGTVLAFRVSCRAAPAVQVGQGCEVGAGGWVEVAPASARTDADALGATGYYRPEDGHLDPTAPGPGIEYCWTNTGDEAARHYGELVCLADPEPLSPASAPVARRLLEGDPSFDQLDNLDFQPRTGIAYVLEDHVHGEVYACLPDGADRDQKSDGCVPVIALKDPTAEPTGFRFTADGTTAFLSVQHSNDAACQAAGSDCADVDDAATDDVVVVTGFEIRPGMLR